MKATDGRSCCSSCGRWRFKFLCLWLNCCHSLGSSCSARYTCDRGRSWQRWRRLRFRHGTGCTWRASPSASIRATTCTRNGPDRCMPAAAAKSLEDSTHDSASQAGRLLRHLCLGFNSCLLRSCDYFVCTSARHDWWNILTVVAAVRPYTLWRRWLLLSLLLLLLFRLLHSLLIHKLFCPFRGFGCSIPCVFRRVLLELLR